MLSRLLHRLCYRFARPQVKSSIADNTAKLSWLEDLRSPVREKQIQEYCLNCSQRLGATHNSMVPPRGWVQLWGGFGVECKLFPGQVKVK